MDATAKASAGRPSACRPELLLCEGCPPKPPEFTKATGKGGLSFRLAGHLTVEALFFATSAETRRVKVGESGPHLQPNLSFERGAHEICLSPSKYPPPQSTLCRLDLRDIVHHFCLVFHSSNFTLHSSLSLFLIDFTRNRVY